MLFECSQQCICLMCDGCMFFSEVYVFLCYVNWFELFVCWFGCGDEGGLCIGYLEMVMYLGVLLCVLKMLCVECLLVYIVLYNYFCVVQFEGLCECSFDIVFVIELFVLDDFEFDLMMVLNDLMLFVLFDGYLFVKKKMLVVDDFVVQVWIGVMQQESVLWYGVFVVVCVKVGFLLDILVEVIELFVVFGFVVVGFGVMMIQ